MPTIRPQFDDLHCEVSGVEGGVVRLSLSLPLDLFRSFPGLLDSINAFLRHGVRRSDINAAVARARSTEYQAGLRRRADAFNASILSTYDFIARQGTSPRVAIRQCRDLLRERGHASITCYDIELIARQAGRLSRRWTYAD